VLDAASKNVFDEQPVEVTHLNVAQSRVLSTKKVQHDQQVVAVNSQSMHSSEHLSQLLVSVSTKNPVPQDPIVSATQVPSTGLTIGVVPLESQLRHQLKVFDHVVHGETQIPLVELLVHSPLVITVFFPHSATQYPFSK
jgi:hypothetical protein